MDTIISFIPKVSFGMLIIISTSSDGGGYYSGGSSDGGGDGGGEQGPINVFLNSDFENVINLEYN